VLLDFERVEYLSSAIITELIRTQKALAKDGGSMAACRLDKRIAEVFSITRIDQVIPVYKSVKEALKQHLKQHGDDEELRALLKGAR
jgi:anti-anti-sigma factor